MTSAVMVNKRIRMSTPCTTCLARPGQHCRTRGGVQTVPHEPRRRKYYREWREQYLADDDD